MRRSSVISARKFQSSVLSASTPESSNLNSENTAVSQNVARSTCSILNLLNKETTVKDTNKLIVPSEESFSVTDKNTICETKENNASNVSIIYNVVWSKRTTKKHKTWEGDGTLQIIGKTAILKDLDGKELGRATQFKSEMVEDGSIHSVGSKEVQIMDLVTNNLSINKRKHEEDIAESTFKKKSSKKTISTNYVVSRTFKKSKLNISLIFQPLVFPTPSSEHQWIHNTNKQPVINVSLDACLAKVLRSHQRTGVVFMYECVMGFRQPECYGAILADEMGLGKTLQCISLIWTLLKQGPYGGVPLVKKVLIVTPSSLTGNWQKEFTNWLGRERINVFVVNSKNKPKEFVRTNKNIMIISYEMCLRYSDDIHEIPFDLLLCDEGHRLKNNTIKLSTMLNQLDCRKRIILTGTPIQNDLQEFYSLINFVNPGVLGSVVEYRKYYEDPIKASRQPGVDDEIRRLGEDRATELNIKTSQFVLRRTQELLDKYLPTKTEVVLFCKCSPLQQKLYTAAVDYWASKECLDNSVVHLAIIIALRKICNHPFLLHSGNNEENLTKRLCDMIPPQKTCCVEDSGKLKVLDGLLLSLKQKNQKIVIVSYYQQTLDLIEDLCTQNKYSFCRLDGSTTSNKRMKIVEQFNSKCSNNFIFLLSAKAGGVGLNLIGASHLVLYDSDWNPATDLQAMSRIWRDGQKKSVFLYRFLTAGTIEEKIFQRQISKSCLSGAVVDPNSPSSIRLSDEELKDLFSLQFNEKCLTHLSLNCDCTCDGSVPCPLKSQDVKDEDKRMCQLGGESEDLIQNLRMYQLMQWEHHSQPINKSVLSNLNLSDSLLDIISFMFVNKCSLE